MASIMMDPMIPRTEPRVLIHPHCELGENPLWHPGEECLYWEDIDAGRVHRFHLPTGDHRVVYEGPVVGGFTFQRNGGVLLFREADLAWVHADGRVEVLRAFSDEGMTRFNDVITDPEGRVFAGTIGKTVESGGLFRFERDGTGTLLFRGTGVSNGMGFSPDGKTFYWTCSTRARIYAYDYDVRTGELSRERLFYQAVEGEGVPDGMAVDEQGDVWSTRWGGYSLVCHAPDGTVRERVRIPAEKVSSVCFGGAGLDECFITTAGGVAGGQTLDGAVFRVSVGRRGMREFESRIEVRG